MPGYKTDNANFVAPRCQHIKLNGEPCRVPAMRGLPFCHFHKAVEQTQSDRSFPFVEDATSLQLALMQIVQCLNVGTLPYKSASLMLYALQIACTNLKNFLAERPAADEDEYGPEGTLARILLEQISQEAPEMGAHIRARFAQERAAATESLPEVR